jgi:hypothetical protein
MRLCFVTLGKSPRPALRNERLGFGLRAGKGGVQAFGAMNTHAPIRLGKYPLWTIGVS